MSRIDEILNLMEQAAANPEQAVIEHADGRKIVGCAPYFVPFEMVDAAGMVPFELWGGGTNSDEASGYYPAFYCSVAVTIMQKAVEGTYDFLSAVIIPTTCDALRNLEENWKFSPSKVPVFPLTQPVNRKVPAAEIYYLEQLRLLQANLEELSGTKITDKALRISINRYNKQRRVMREFLQEANKHLDLIKPTTRQAVIKCAQIMPVDKHTALVEELLAELAALPTCNFEGKKVIVTGIVLDSPRMLETLDQYGLAIVGDDMPSGSKRFEKDTPDNVDPFVSIARIWPNLEGCSMLFDPKKTRVDILLKMFKDTQADGILIDILKFCEEDEFDYPILKRRFEEAGVPMLYIETEQQATMDEQAATRIQSFAEMLA